MKKSLSDSPHSLHFTRRQLFSLSSGALILGAGGLTALSVKAQTSAGAAGLADVQALIFDVFGTVVDWRSSIIREGQLLAARKGFQVDWGEFADRWRSGYGPAMNQVRSGELPWTKIDDLHRMILDRLVVEYGMGSLSETELRHFNKAWHRLMPWPDTVAGLNRLKTRYVIATMSNGNVSLLLNMAKNAGLPWDTI
ncbi:MAG: hypothetical protein KDI29_10135, partial [Pseudomonadales bacterium]|nr:hypothetical protein [Pseudomonadales bacterium]